MGYTNSTQNHLYIETETSVEKKFRNVSDDWYLAPADVVVVDDESQGVKNDDLEEAANAFLVEAEEELASETDLNLVEQEDSTKIGVKKSSLSKNDDNQSVNLLDALVGNYEDGDSELSWQVDALCAQTDPEAFFPEKGGSTRDAKKVCTACNVRSQCLAYALSNDERFGIWGGLSERERRKMRKRIV